MYTITKTFTFDSAHKLWDKTLSNEENFKIFGKCFAVELDEKCQEACHGHTYFVEVTLKSNELINGMVRNFAEVKDVYKKKIHDKYDHQFLNNLMPFLTTAENMAKYFFELLVVDFPELYSVAVYETPTSKAEYIKDNV